MKSKPLFGEDGKPDSLAQWVFDNALGKVIVLDEAATTANAIVPEGEVGYFSNKLYFSIGGTTFSLNLTAV